MSYNPFTPDSRPRRHGGHPTDRYPSYPPPGRRRSYVRPLSQTGSELSLGSRIDLFDTGSDIDFDLDELELDDDCSGDEDEGGPYPGHRTPSPMPQGRHRHHASSPLGYPVSREGYRPFDSYLPQDPRGGPSGRHPGYPMQPGYSMYSGPPPGYMDGHTHPGFPGHGRDRTRPVYMDVYDDPSLSGRHSFGGEAHGPSHHGPRGRSGHRGHGQLPRHSGQRRPSFSQDLDSYDFLTRSEREEAIRHEDHLISHANGGAPRGGSRRRGGRGGRRPGYTEIRF